MGFPPPQMRDIHQKKLHHSVCIAETRTKCTSKTCFQAVTHLSSNYWHQVWEDVLLNFCFNVLWKFVRTFVTGDSVSLPFARELFITSILTPIKCYFLSDSQCVKKDTNLGSIIISSQHASTNGKAFLHDTQLKKLVQISDIDIEYVQNFHCCT